MKFRHIALITMISLFIIFTKSHTTFALENISPINYNNNEFYIEDNLLNLIINHIYIQGENLIVDGYLYNSTNNSLNEISNLYLQLEDRFNVIFGKASFLDIPIDGKLLPNQGKKVSLIFDKSHYNLTGKSLLKINWQYKCDYK